MTTENAFTVVNFGLTGGFDEDAAAFAANIGKTVTAALVAENVLLMKFNDGSEMTVKDIADICCEKRYMVCDDDLSKFTGAKLLGGDLRTVDQSMSEDQAHEIQFLIIKTSAGEFTVSNHNEHNGYYSGFGLHIENRPAKDAAEVEAEEIARRWRETGQPTIVELDAHVRAVNETKVEEPPPASPDQPDPPKAA